MSDKQYQFAVTIEAKSQREARRLVKELVGVVSVRNLKQVIGHARSLDNLREAVQRAAA